MKETTTTGKQIARITTICLAVILTGVALTARMTTRSGLVGWQKYEPFSVDDKGRWLQEAVTVAAQKSSTLTRTMDGKTYVVKDGTKSLITGCFESTVEIDGEPYRGQVCGGDKQRVPAL